MREIFTTKGQLKKGDEGEKIIIDFLQNCKQFNSVVHLNCDCYKHLRKYDIDYVCSKMDIVDNNILMSGNINDINDKYITIELKTDEKIHSTGNLFLEDEIIRVRDNKTIDGYMKKSKAQILLYLDNNEIQKKLYAFNFKKLREYYDRNKNIFKKPRNPVKSQIIGTNDIGEVYGYLVNVSELIKNGIGVEVNKFKVI